MSAHSKKYKRFSDRYFEPDPYIIDEFVRFAASQVHPSSLVLDAGSGRQQYKVYFNHAKYESTDIEPLPGSEHQFLCSLDKIPKPDNTYDTILCTQTLEHVEFPQRVIDELYRVLKPSGMLFLTAPQGAAVHGAPYHFFNFTEFGLASLFKRAGFEIDFIRPHGGCFLDLGKRILSLPRYLASQYRDRQLAPKISGRDRLCWAVLAISLTLFKPIYRVFLPVIAYYLDSLDKRRHWTLGYSCFCRKPKLGPVTG